MRTGKLHVDAPKARKKHGAAFYVIGTFTFAIESMLGINAAFLVDQSIAVVAKNMLAGTPLEIFSAFISLVVSLAVGFCFIFGGMWVFSGFMDSLDDAEAYIEHYGTRRWPVRMVWSLFVAVILLDFTTLLFRASYFNEKGATALFCFFVILIFLPPVLGPLIHVLEHTPRDRRLAKTRRMVEEISVEQLEQVAQVMDPDLRERWLNDDPTALQEHYARVDQQRADNEAFERQRMEERDARRRNKQRPLPSASQG